VFLVLSRSRTTRAVLGLDVVLEVEVMDFPCRRLHRAEEVLPCRMVDGPARLAGVVLLRPPADVASRLVGRVLPSGKLLRQVEYALVPDLAGHVAASRRSSPRMIGPRRASHIDGCLSWRRPFAPKEHRPMPQLALYDTMQRAKMPFVPLDPSWVRMYVCGPTVYDYAHIGNARPAVVFDVLYRVLRKLAAD